MESFMRKNLNSNDSNEKPNIAYFVSMVSGLETFVKNEVEALYGKGFKISLFVTKYRKSLGFEPRSELGLYKPSVMHVFIGIITTAFLSPMLFIRLLTEAIGYKALVEFFLALSWRRRIEIESCDALHAAFGDRKFFVAYFVHRLTGLPLSVAIHAHEIYAQPNDALFRHALQYTDKVLTISETNRSILVNKYGVSLQKIELIRLPVDTSFWKSEQRITVLTVARFTPRKGWVELVAAAKILGDRFQFVAVGFGDLDLDEIIAEAGVEDFFVVYPKLNSKQLKIIMQFSDIFCLPSKPTDDEGSEGIPVVLMESMAMGLPIVTTSDGSIGELVDDIIVDPGDVDSLVCGLQEAAESLGNKKVVIGARNRNKVCALHGPENIDLVDRYFETLIEK